MKRVAAVLLALLALALAFGLALFAASELGGEVVKLHTRDASGAEHVTSLWVVDHEGYAYLRGGNQASGWVERLRAQPEVTVERDGRSAAYRAEPAPELTRAIEARMAEKYGLADRIVGVIRNPERSLAVRLVPAS
jgi:hypothetical protein